MNFKRPEIVGVVNITEDSFSDGGKFLRAEDAIAHAEKLLFDGADILDLGAASSNPHASFVSAEEEIRRLEPVVAHLQEKEARISIDSTKPEVQRWAIQRGVEFLNDIRGFPDVSLYPELARSDAKLIVMHFISDLDKAVRVPKSVEEVTGSIKIFFDARLPLLESAGMSRERLIVDPGMGFFLASNPEPSLAVLGTMHALRERYQLPTLVGVSRKSFLKNIPARTDAGRSGGAEPETCDIAARTLAAELAASLQGVDYIRTHDVGALSNALLTLGAIHKVAGDNQTLF